MIQTLETTLGKYVEHLTQGFTPELARQFADLPAPHPELQARLDELAEKANEGHLGAAEAGEYEQYIHLLDFVALLRLKARARAGQQSNGA